MFLKNNEIAHFFCSFRIWSQMEKEKESHECHFKKALNYDISFSNGRKVCTQRWYCGMTPILMQYYFCSCCKEKGVVQRTYEGYFICQKCSNKLYEETTFSAEFLNRLEREEIEEIEKKIHEKEKFVQEGYKKKKADAKMELKLERTEVKVWIREQRENVEKMKATLAAASTTTAAAAADATSTTAAAE
jgi:ribosomal protein L37AE/L43A